MDAEQQIIRHRARRETGSEYKIWQDTFSWKAALNSAARCQNLIYEQLNWQADQMPSLALFPRRLLPIIITSVRGATVSTGLRAWGQGRLSQFLSSIRLPQMTLK